ncbi:MAG: TolC family protein [Saprospiraceae bacterium]|nr:TolC family protein [Saprospiraceae bacterium]
MKKTELFFTLGLMITFTFHSRSQEIWNLEKCIKYGLERNAMLKQAEFNLGNSAINLKSSKMQMLPNLNGNVNSGLSIGRNIDPTTNNFITQNIVFGSYGLNAGIMLFKAGELRNSIRSNQATFVSTQKEFEQAVNDVSLQIAANYLAVLLAEERLLIAKKSLELASEQTVQIKKLVLIGTKAEVDALELESAEARSQQNHTMAFNALEQALMQLKQSMRFDLLSELVIEKISEEKLRNLQNEFYTSENLFGIALNNQPGIQASKKRLEASQFQRRIARAQYFPTISGFANINSRYSDAAIRPIEFGTRIEKIEGKVNGTPISLEYEQPIITKTEVIPFGKQFDQFLGYNFGIGLSIPIYNNYSVTANVKRSEIQLEQAELELNTRTENLNSEIIQAVANVKLSLKELEAAQKSADLAKQVNENTIKKYSIGTANNFELTTARTNHDSAQNSLLIAKYDLLFKQKILDLYAGKSIW